MSLNFSTFCAALAASGLLLAASGAQAFTIEETGTAPGGGSNLMAPSPFNDPVKKETDKNGGTRSQFGGTTVYVGPSNTGSAERDFYSGVNRMFSPLGRPPN
jgi:hypothetical protein